MKTFPKMSLDPFPHQSTVHPHNLISLTHFAVFSAIRTIYFFKSFISLKVINQFLVVGNIVMFFDPAKLLVVETHPTRVLEGWRRDKSVKSRVPSYLSLPSSIASYLHALLWSLMDTRRECLMATDSEASRGSSGGIGEIKKREESGSYEKSFDDDESCQIFKHNLTDSFFKLCFNLSNEYVIIS